VGTLPSRFRLFAIALLALGAISALGSIAAPPADAQSSCGEDGCVDVVAVNGLIDEIEADLIERSIDRANQAGDVVAVVLQFDSNGSAVSDERLNEVAEAIVDSVIPVSIWIGASGSAALGGAAELVQIADASGITPGSDIGDVGIQRLDQDVFGDLFEGRAAAGLHRTFSGEAAVKVGLVDNFDAVLVNHVGGLDAVDTKVETVDGKEQQQPVQRVRLSKLPLQMQLLHTAASPSVAYLLLIIGLGLLLFEFFTAGVGVAGVVGAGFVILGGYGVAALPFTPWALALLLFSFFGFAIDMQTGVPRLWTIISMSAYTVGSIFLFVEFRPTWMALLAGIAGMGVVVFSGMPAMIRTRFATPTIGREWMIGELGEVTTDVSPDGMVEIRGAEWRARTNRATPVLVGERIRVVEIDGLVLEVEPEEGGAIDYREMRDRRKGGAAADGPDGTEPVPGGADDADPAATDHADGPDGPEDERPN
jgi:membrane-bound serine protease (ClpP class)